MDVIYLDRLFGLNLLLDYCLMLASARVCGVVLRRGRYLLAALTGALYAAVMVLPGCGWLGSGAMKLALTYPERYGYAASFSGAVDCFNQKDLSEIQDPKMLAMRLAMQDELNWIFGPEEGRRGSKNDVMALLETCDPAKAPKLYASCGLDDDLYEGNVAFRDKARALGYDLDYYEEEGVGHEWRFWNREIEKLIADIPAKPL